MSKEFVQLEIQDSGSIDIDIQQQNKQLTIHVDYDNRMEENEKKIMMYIQIDPKMITNLMKESASGFDDERKLIKNCIFSKKFQTPISKIKGTFFITYIAYKGIIFNISLITEDQDEITYSRVKVHYVDDEQKWRVKWLQCEKQQRTFSSIISASSISKILRQKLLLQIYFDKKRNVEKKFIGIQNQGNTCYMNSILQVLFHVIPIRKIIIQKDIQSSNKLLKSVQQLFMDLLTSKSSANASNILKNFKQFCEYPYRQQDIHEFLMNFIDKLQEECPELRYLWSGKDYEIVKSKDRRYESKQQTDFNELQLHMTDTQSNNFRDIKESLMALLNEENVDEKIQTDKYGKVQVNKIRFFETLPPLLFMNVKRYEYNAKRRQLSKICLDLDYPQRINLDFLMKTPGTKLQYLLYAVTVHKGRTPNSGHYFSFINVSKTQKKPEWHQFNDSIVSKVKTQKIYEYTGKRKMQTFLNQKYGKWCERMIYSEETAYLLVYLRKDLFNEYQNSQIKLPQWYIEREKRKLTEEQEKTKCSVRFCLMPVKEQIDMFSRELQLTPIKVQKKGNIEKQFSSLLAFVDFKIGTVWRVNKQSQKIRYVGRKLGGKCNITVDLLNRTKHGFKSDEYFLVAPLQKCHKLGHKLGMLEIEYLKQDAVQKQLLIDEKCELQHKIEQLNRSTKHISINKQKMREYKNDWNDYLCVRVQ